MAMSRSAEDVLFNDHIMCMYVFPKLSRRNNFSGLQEVERNVALEMVDSRASTSIGAPVRILGMLGHQLQ